MSKVYNHKGKGLSLESTIPQTRGEMREQVLLYDTSYSKGKKLYPNWEEIYRMFAKEQYSKDNED